MHITLQIDEIHAMLKAAGEEFATPSLDQLFEFAKPMAMPMNWQPELVLGKALGISGEDLSAVSVACATAIADGIEVTTDYCLRADPVSLIAATSKVFLMGPAGYDLTNAERHSLEQVFNQQFAADGLRFQFPNNHRWYVQAPADHIPTQLLPAPRSLLGENIATTVTKLDGYWQRSFTEAQMLLYADPLRLQREQSGTPPLSGLWFWGGGQFLQNLTPTGAGINCSGRSSLLQGLASIAGANWSNSIQATAAEIIHWSAEQVGSAIEQLEELEQAVFQPLLQAVNAGGQIQLHSSDAGAWTIRKSFTWPWRKHLTAQAVIDKQLAKRQ